MTGRRTYNFPHPRALVKGDKHPGYRRYRKAACRPRLLEDCDHDDLAAVMRPLIGNPDRAEAIRDAIERRSFGEVAA